MVGNKPYVVRGVCYNPVPIGQNYDYNWWSEQYKPWLIDGALMKEMGINTIRVYQAGQDPAAVKQVIRDLYDKFGIRTLLGHWLGFWEYPCPLYGDKDFQDRIQKDVLEMVRLYKDEPGLLGWILGNENNYSCFGHVNPWSTDEIDKEPDIQKRKNMRARIYYSFVNILTQQIHALDKNHPVGLGNGELITLDIAKEICPEADFIACIIYRGKTFGNLFKSLKSTFDKPLLLSEIGADAYDAFKQKEDQNMQAFFLESVGHCPAFSRQSFSRGHVEEEDDIRTQPFCGQLVDCFHQIKVQGTPETLVCSGGRGIAVANNCDAG